MRDFKTEIKLRVAISFFIILPLLQSDEFFVRFQKGFRIKYLVFSIEEVR